jgi:N-acetylmuramate 1-kinase
MRRAENKAEEYNMHNRQNALHRWLEQLLSPAPFTLTPLTGDASFRRYFRLHYNDFSQVIMDAPPEKENIEPFLAIANLLRRARVRVPQIYALDKVQGFVILEDFGDTLMLNELCLNTADKLYTAAIKTLITMQEYLTPSLEQLPSFDKQFIFLELNLFSQWFLGLYLAIELTSKEERLIQETFTWLSKEICQQPQVFVHRDYHSRNIMRLPNDQEIALGIIDFQDAMRGPVTYDLVSLLKDCYIQWPREQVMSWLSDFHRQAPSAKQYSLQDFSRAFDLCGLQRHLKILGIFSRLYLRDKKPKYLQDLPLTLHYVMDCLESYEELKPFYQFMQNRIRLP